MEKLVPRVLLWLQSSMSPPANAETTQERTELTNVFRMESNLNLVSVPSELAIAAMHVPSKIFSRCSIHESQQITTNKGDLEKQAGDWINNLADINILGVRVIRN